VALLRGQNPTNSHSLLGLKRSGDPAGSSFGVIISHSVTSLSKLMSVYCILLTCGLCKIILLAHSHGTMLNPVYIPPNALEEADSSVKIEDDDEITVNKNALDSED